ncbi:MAG: pyrroline-5-carboxylate reductase [Clostridiales bacterium]|nr:pyrroline-5-carboxylate reductase [Clostridiales bacterium]
MSYNENRNGLSRYKVGFIGAGNMGGALIKSIARYNKEALNNNPDGGELFSVSAFDINSELLKKLADETGITEETSAESLAKNCDIIILAIKPQYCDNVLKEIKPAITDKKIIVSVIVGLSTQYFKRVLGSHTRVVRTMPNTPALVGEGMTLISWDDSINEEERKAIIELFSCSGRVEELEESLMNEVTALTGSSPAYVFILIEAMADAAVKSGIQRNLAYRLAAQTVMGSAKMVLETGKHPAELKDMVCSPAGTTIEAVAVLEQEGFRNAIIKAMDQCTKRAREIGKKNFDK